MRQKPVVRFGPIEAIEPLRSIDVDDLKNDQKYLYAVCLALTSAKFHDDLEYINPGNICQSRWLTLANRALRLYARLASITTPSKNLKTWADFIVNVYVPSWFDIKCQPKCIIVPIHL